MRIGRKVVDDLEVNVDVERRLFSTSGKYQEKSDVMAGATFSSWQLQTAGTSIGLAATASYLNISSRNADFTYLLQACEVSNQGFDVMSASAFLGFNQQFAVCLLFLYPNSSFCPCGSISSPGQLAKCILNALLDVLVAHQENALLISTHELYPLLASSIELIQAIHNMT